MDSLNTTNDTDFEAIFFNVNLYQFFFLITTFLAFSIGLLVIFPFYLHVNRVNSVKDEKTLIYPFTNHFYEMVKKTYLLFTLLASAIVCACCANCAETGFVFVPMMVSSIILALILHTMAQVFHCLISVLAIQKFLLYFFPFTEKYIVSAQKLLFSYIKWVYVLYGIEETIHFYSLFWCLGTCEEQKKRELHLQYSIRFAVLNSLLITCSLLYIPIMISIRKHSNLPVVQESKPQRYIYWQAMMVLLFKSTSVPFMLVLYYRGVWLIYIVLLVAITDIIMIPLIVQISYLSSNQRNVDIILRILFGCKKNLSSVEPVYERSSAVS